MKKETRKDGFSFWLKTDSKNSKLYNIDQTLKMTTKQMETKVYNLVSCLADNFGFDADAAFEYARWETDVDHVGEILKMTETEKPKKVAPKKEEVKDDESESSASSDIGDKIAACKKNIDLWEKKLKEGKVKDEAKQREKIDKEKAKLSKLEAKAPPKTAEKPKDDKKPAKKEQSADKEKRIKRFSPVMTSQLKTALEGAGLEMNDKLKKEFQQFIEDLADDDYRSSGLADHMRAFAKLKSPVSEVAAPIEELDDESDSDEDDKPPAMPPSNVSGGGPDTKEISLKELQSISMTAEVGTTGQYWDADNGRFVKGPEHDDEEDFIEKKFEGKDYVIGEKTGRVYEARETGDVFAGFAGVGKFKALTI